MHARNRRACNIACSYTSSLSSHTPVNRKLPSASTGSAVVAQERSSATSTEAAAAVATAAAAAAAMAAAEAGDSLRCLPATEIATYLKNSSKCIKGLLGSKRAKPRSSKTKPPASARVSINPHSVSAAPERSRDSSRAAAPAAPAAAPAAPPDCTRCSKRGIAS